MSLANLLLATAARSPDRVALVGPGRSLTYSALADDVARLAGGLVSLGLAPGDRVATLLPTSVDLVVTLLAAAWAELIAVPVLPGYAPPQVEYVLGQSGARCLVTSPALLAAAAPAGARRLLDWVVTTEPAEECVPLEGLRSGPGLAAVSTMPDPIGLLVYTSGTTSRPKGVAHAQGRMARRVDLLVEELALTSDDATLLATDAGRPIVLLGQVLPMLHVGGQVHLPPPSGPFWEAYRAARPSYLLTSPATAVGLLDHPDASGTDHGRLRFWIVGGDKAPAALYRAAARVVGRPLLEMCGMTETGFYAINPLAGPIKEGSIGLAMRGVAVRLVSEQGGDDDVAPGQVGRVMVRTPDMMVGYWNDTLRTYRAVRTGWLDTGDLARADEDGYLWFVARTSEVICRGAVKVSPAAVEAALEEHPAVLRAAVVPIADARQGQLPFAFFELRTGAAPPGEGDLFRWAAGRVDPPSVPVDFARVESWPLTSQGKLDRARLTWMAEAGGQSL